VDQAHRPRCSPTRSSHVIARMHAYTARQPTRSGDAVVNAVERASQVAAGAVIINMHACYPFTSCATSASAEKVTPTPPVGSGLGRKGHRCDRPQPHCPCQQTWPTELNTSLIQCPFTYPQQVERWWRGPARRTHVRREVRGARACIHTPGVVTLLAFGPPSPCHTHHHRSSPTTHFVSRPFCQRSKANFF
jgi:hypothetical protein